MKRPREGVKECRKPKHPAVMRQGRVLEVFPVSMFEQARQVRGYIVLPQDIERGAVGVVSAEQRALQGHKPYMKLINVLNRKAVTEMRHTNSVATVVYHALKQQLHECQPLLHEDQDIVFGISLINFVAAGQHSHDESFFLLSQIIHTQPVLRPKSKRQMASCGTWVVCCILKTQIPSVSLDFRPMGGMSIIYEATTVAQEYDKYITRGVQCKIEKSTPLSFPLNRFTTLIPETSLFTPSPPEKSIDKKEETETVEHLPPLSTCDEKSLSQNPLQLTTVRTNLHLPGIQCLLQKHPDTLLLPPISHFSSKQLPL